MTSPRLGLAHVRGALLVALVASSLVGCLAHERDDGDAAIACGDACDAGSQRDAGTDAIVLVDAGGPPDVGWCECPAPPPGCTYDGTPCSCSHLSCPSERCGRVVCATGTTCCNPTCGTCVAPGVGCVDIACAPDCSPQDASSGGRCAGTVGWAWDGTACRAIACTCVGTECDAIFPTQADCDAYFGTCPVATP